ncbi:molybdenum cofactor biosynthesis protein B [Peribacillus loiseleuriae]|uniref:MogA/MoaB family molybdenum cofactor biosynthesis protein n=1 Tax=Peribacillus loiseleuriae TaxID=1679170 RepID=UPI0038288205
MLHDQKKEFINCKVITVSDSRTADTDYSGQLMKELLLKNGHIVTAYEVVTDEKTEIVQAFYSGCLDPKIDAILLNGGTGLAKRDVTIESIQPLLHKEMGGFGEIFRMLSYTEDIGSAAILSRAIAGVCNNTAVYCTPGSVGAVKLAMEKLIIPELGHVISEIRKNL